MNSMSNISNADLWKKYKKTKSKEIKEELITKYIEIVKIIAGRLYNSYNSAVEYEDLVGYGIIGLIDAIEKFDPSKNIKFETYANFRIRGAIVDQIRSLDWVPRSIRQKHKKIENALKKLQNTYGTDIDDKTLAEELGIDCNQLNDYLLEVSISSIISLDEKLSENANIHIEPLIYKNDPESNIIKEESKRLLIEAIEELPERERMIINLYYFSELTYKEIANILSISESRVSQLHTKAIIKIKNKLEESN